MIAIELEGPEGGSDNTQVGDDDDGVNNANEEVEEQQVVEARIGNLPDEMWLLIFEYVGGGRDLINCSKICRHWERVLTGTIQNAWKFNEIFPLIRPYLRKRDILRCRLVCWLWEKVVDNWASNRVTMVPFTCNKKESQFDAYWNDELYDILSKQQFTRHVENLKFYACPRNSVLDWNGFHYTVHFKRFYKKFGKLARIFETGPPPTFPRNPFIGRGLFLSDFKYNPSLIYSLFSYFGYYVHPPVPVALISSVGKHIWHLKLEKLSMSCSDCKGGGVQLLKALQDCLQYVPNLKSLDISFCVNDRYGEFEYTPKCKSRLEKYILPSLPRLETLKIFSSKLLFPAHLTLLEKYSGQLRKVDIYDWDKEESLYDWKIGPAAKFPVLQEMTICFNFDTTAINALSHFADSPLQTLAVEIKGTVQVPKFQLLMEHITNLFGDTLRLFLIKIHVVDQLPVREFPVPPNLSSLMLTGYVECSLNFLLQLASSLKYLTLVLVDDYQHRRIFPREAIDLRDFIQMSIPIVGSREVLEIINPARRVYSSNIWKVLPKLRKLSIHFLEAPLKDAVTWDPPENPLAKLFVDQDRSRVDQIKKWTFSRGLYDYTRRNNLSQWLPAATNDVAVGPDDDEEELMALRERNFDLYYEDRKPKTFFECLCIFAFRMMCTYVAKIVINKVVCDRSVRALLYLVVVFAQLWF